jgi:N-formylmaleamate deformylase
MRNESNFRYGGHAHANGIRLHYLRYGGAGTPVIFVPGIASPAVGWGFVAERLGKRFDVYIMDVRGRGLSESGDHLDYGLDACAADVNELAAALGIDRYIVMGHSMGARIGIRAARTGGRALEHLVLIDPPVSGPGRREYPMPLAPYIELLEKARRGHAYEQIKSKYQWKDEHIRLRAEWMHTCDTRAIITAHRGFHEDDIHQDLPHIKVPTSLMVAGKGGVILPEDIREIEKLMPSIAVARVDGAGHMIPFDDSEGFFTALNKFLGTDV